MNFEGIFTPVVTPYTERGEIDLPIYTKLIESLIEAGVHGIIVGGSTGEYYSQSMTERKQLAETARQVTDKRLPLIVGTGATRTEESIEYAQHAKNIGADAILVTSPPYALPTESENAQHALRIDLAAQLPIMLYNYPGRMGVNMGPDYFELVSQSSNIKAIKESSGDFNNLHQIAINYPHIALSCGWDDQALEFFAWGAKSWVCAGSNFIPKEHLALYQACVIEKDFTQGRKIMAAMMPLMNYLEGGKFVQSIRSGVKDLGLSLGAVRSPLQDLEKDEQQELRLIIEDVKQNVARAINHSEDDNESF